MSSSPLFERFGKTIPKGTVLFREGISDRKCISYRSAGSR